MIGTLLLASLLTIDGIVAQHPIDGDVPRAFSWAPDGSAYVYSVPGKNEGDPPLVRLYDVRTRNDRPLLRAASEQRGSRSRDIAQIVWSNDSRHVAIVNAGALEVIDPADGASRTLAKDADDPQWSPDDRSIAYVHRGDLYAVDVETQQSRRLTTTGSDTRINGDPDWLYSEEMGVEHAFAWSPDGARIAYLSFNEAPISAFPVENFVPRINHVEEQRYPLAGDRNPAVSLNVVDVANATSHLLYDGAPHDDYVLSFTWSPDGTSVLDEIVDRAQQHLRWTAFGLDGSARTIVEESDPKFIAVEPVPRWSHDGRTLYLLSERGGTQSLWEIDAKNGAARRVTGAYTVCSTERIDEKNGVAYVQALYPTRRDRSLLRVSLATGSLVNLTPGGGNHAVVFARNGAQFVETDSSDNVPPVVSVRALDTTTRTVVFQTPSLATFHLGHVRALQVPSQWGPLDARLVVPAGFDAHKRYPVIFTPYGGPIGVDNNEAANRWSGLFPFFLAQHGYLVFTVAGPASNADSAAAQRLYYHSMGEIAMAGQLAGAAWMKKQSYADGTRFGLVGWSYGGYLTAFTMTHAPGVFRAGIAGAPPADWRFYDSAYTERYMGMPKEQRAAYDETSVLPAAKSLTGSLLILQGTSDDNVHLMNSLSMLDAFMQAGKRVNYFVYPGERHGPRKVFHRRDLDARMLEWWDRTLK